MRIASFVEMSWNRYVGSVAAAEVRMTSRLETEIRLEERIAGGIVLCVIKGQGTMLILNMVSVRMSGFDQ